MASSHARVRAQLRGEIVEIYRESRTSAEQARVTAAAQLRAAAPATVRHVPPAARQTVLRRIA
jgi:hypothetical protein